MDYDDFNPDDEIGRCVLPLKDLSQETRDLWLDVDMEADNAADNDHPKVLPHNFPNPYFLYRTQNLPMTLDLQPNEPLLADGNASRVTLLGR